MTDIMIDLTSKPHKRYEVHRCHYCSHDKYLDGKPIDPTTDKNAKQTSKGDWKCGACVLEDTKKLLKMFQKGE